MSADFPVIHSFEGRLSADGQMLLIRATGFDASITSFAIPVDNVKHFIAFLLAWVGTLSEASGDADAPDETQIMPIPATSIAVGAPSGQEGYIGISVGRAELVFALPLASFGPATPEIRPSRQAALEIGRVSLRRAETA